MKIFPKRSPKYSNTSRAYIVLFLGLTCMECPIESSSLLELLRYMHIPTKFLLLRFLCKESDTRKKESVPKAVYVQHGRLTRLSGFWYTFDTFITIR